MAKKKKKMDVLVRCETDLINLKATELRLGLPGTDMVPATKCNKRALADLIDECASKSNSKESDEEGDDEEGAPATK